MIVAYNYKCKATVCSSVGLSAGPFTIREYAVFKRFLREGKATIKLVNQRLQLMVSNCPPEQLSWFLKSLVVKMAARGKLQGSHRRMLGDISTQFDEISPLNQRDLEKARVNSTGNCNKENATPSRLDHTKGVKLGKRKLTGVNREAQAKRAMLGGEREARGATQGKEKEAETKEVPDSEKLLINPRLSNLSEEQLRVMDLVRQGESVFFTGSAGTGKSFLMRRIIGMLPPHTTYPTASTGAAACLIGGTTLHSFAGIGTGSGTLEQCIALASREHKAVHWRRCCCLIIDEISMVEGKYFDKLEAVARAVRKSKKPFGGIQLVLCGDFLQLPPVSKGKEEKNFCFQVATQVHNTCQE